MKKIVAPMLAGVLAMGMLAGCGGTTETVPMEPEAGTDEYKLVMKLSHAFSSEEQLSKSMESVAERIYEKTNGAIEIQCYGQGQLATYKDGVEQVVSGAQFISVEDPSYLGDYVPDFKPLVGPMLYQTYDEYVQMVETDLVQGMIKEAENYNIKILGLDYIFGFRNLMTNKIVVSPEDMMGLQIRTPSSDMFIDTINAMGATATPLSFSETLSGVAEGVIDGLEGSEFTNLGTKAYEHTKNVAETKHFLGTCGVYFPLNIWETIPEEYQEIIAYEFDFGGEEMTRICTESYEETREELENHGVAFNTVDYDAFQEAISGVYADMEENDGVTLGIYEALQSELERIRA